MERILLTADGSRKLNDELKRLKSIDRPKIISAIAEARAHGDLTENAEYHAAREQQSLIEGRIKELDSIVGRSEVIDVASLSGPIKFGATVTLEDDDTGQKRTYKLVSEPEADISKGRLNLNSPLARELIGKDVDDYVEVSAPAGTRGFTIIEVKYT